MELSHLILIWPYELCINVSISEMSKTEANCYVTCPSGGAINIIRVKSTPESMLFQE